MKLTPQEWTLVSAFGGVLLGGILTFIINLMQLRQQHDRETERQMSQHEHERMLAFNTSRRDAYLQVLTWFALVRTDLTRSISAGKAWGGTDVVERWEAARIDALAEMYGSQEFRGAVARWPPGFQALAYAHDKWLFLFQQTPQAERGRDENLATAMADLQDRMTTLAEILRRVQEVARHEATDLASAP